MEGTPPGNAAVKSVNETTVYFLNRTVHYNGNPLTNADKSKHPMAIWTAYKSSFDKYCLSWHKAPEVYKNLCKADLLKHVCSRKFASVPGEG